MPLPSPALLLTRVDEALGLLRRVAEAVEGSTPSKALMRRQTPPSADSILPLADVVWHLPFEEKEARRWVKDHVPSRVVRLHARELKLYRWGDVLDAMPYAEGVDLSKPATAQPDRTSGDWQSAAVASV